MTLKEYITTATGRLTDEGFSTPRLDAELIVAKILGVDRTDLIIRGTEKLSESVQRQIEEILIRRLSGEPIAHFIGEKEFYSLNFTVNKHVLVPRPETEIIVDTALSIIDSQKATKIIDFGSGSGCIGATILKLAPLTSLIAIDISPDAVEVTKLNLNRLRVADRALVLCDDIHKLDTKNQTFKDVSLIVANPPYVDVDDPLLDTKTLRFEPGIALYSKDAGYRDPIAWAEKSAQILQPGGTLLMEIGAGQSERLGVLFKKWYKKVSLLDDLAGIPRVIWAEK